MALRLIQIFMPENHGHDLATLLDGREVLGTWRDECLAILPSAYTGESESDRATRMQMTFCQ